MFMNLCSRTPCGQGVHEQVNIVQVSPNLEMIIPDHRDGQVGDDGIITGMLVLVWCVCFWGMLGGFLWKPWPFVPSQKFYKRFYGNYTKVYKSSTTVLREAYGNST